MKTNGQNGTWARVRLSTVTRVVRGRVKPQEHPELPFIGMDNVEAHTMRLLGTVPSSTMKSASVYFFPGDVLYGRLRPYLNKVLALDFEGLASAEFIPLTVPEGVVPKFLQYRINASDFVSYASRLDEGDRPRVDYEQIGAFELDLPPFGEQQRIVAAIESYLTRLDDAMATLERVQRNLKRYRASVLKAAVEGRLVPTEAELARAEGRSYEPASVLLERIRAERRRRWEEAELAKMKAKGKVPKDEGWKASYDEPVSALINDLPEPPDGWAWATLDLLAAVKGGITKGQKQRPGESYRKVPYLRVANVQRGFLDVSDVRMIEASEATIEELRLEPGDVLFNEGGDRDKLGRGWIWRDEIPECIHQNHVFRARIYSDDLQPELLSWYGNTNAQRYFFEEGKQTTNLASINMTKLRRLPVPVPPRAEQLRIREAVEQKLSVLDEVLTSTSSEVLRCTRLRQSILKWAFEGQLVDPDPTDEPASFLLERIRAERQLQNNQPRKARSRKT